MSCNPRHLSVLAYAYGFTLWHYRSTTDTCDEIRDPAYFKPANDMLCLHDLIIYNAKDGDGSVFYGSGDVL